MTDEEAERWLFEDGEWVPSSYVVPFLQADAADQIARWAGTDDGERPILRTRARMLEYRRADGSIAKRQRNRLFGFFWRSEAVASNCAAGNFERRSDNLLLVATGVELSKDDLDRLLGAEPPVATIAPTRAAPADGRAVLPMPAQPADIDNEVYAHAAAALVREGFKLEKAIRETAPLEAIAKDRNAAPASVVRAIRRTYEKMYGPHGQPLVRN